MNCKQVREHLADILDGQTPPSLAQHLDACDECAALIGALRQDMSLLAAMPAVVVPTVVLDKVMGEVTKVSRTRRAWRFFVPRLAPVAAALAMTVLSYNLTPDLWPWQRVTPAPPSEISGVTPQTTAEDGARAFPIVTEIAGGTGERQAALAQPPSPWLVSSLAGGAAFALWAGVVYLWYKKREA